MIRHQYSWHSRIKHDHLRHGYSMASFLADKQLREVVMHRGIAQFTRRLWLTILGQIVDDQHVHIRILP